MALSFSTATQTKTENKDEKKSDKASTKASIAKSGTNVPFHEQTLATHGHSPYYWYSWSDVHRLVFGFRRQYIFNSNSLSSTDFHATRENTHGIFLADPYSAGNFATSLLNDVGKITSGTTRWSTHPPTLLIIPVIAGLHWLTIKITIDYTTGAVNVLYHDPYGEANIEYLNQLHSLIQKSISDSIDMLFKAFASTVTPKITYKYTTTDQQNHSPDLDKRNSWDCGPITLSNIASYLQGNLPEIPSASSGQNRAKIAAARNHHRLLFAEISGADLMMPEDSKDETISSQRPGLNHPLIQFIPEHQLPLFIGLLEDQRLFSKKPKTDPYTQEELESAFAHLQQLTQATSSAEREWPLPADDPIFLVLCALSRYDLKERKGAGHEEKAHVVHVANQGWKLLLDSGERAGDYRGVAFVHLTKKVMVIAHRGTKIDPSKDELSEENVIADYLIATGQVPETILASAFGFCDEVHQAMRKNKQDGFLMYQTGFSLGGWLAGMTGAYVAKRWPATNGLTISVDSPGTLPAARTLMVRNQVVDNSTHTVDYIFKPVNLISKCGQRMAREVRTLESTVSGRSHIYDSPHALSEIKFDQETGVEVLFQLLDLIKSHHLNSYINLAAKKLTFTATSSYVVRELTAISGETPFDLMAYVRHQGGRALMGAGNFSYNAITELPAWAQFGMVLAAGYTAYNYGDKIGEAAEKAMTKVGELLERLEPYQALLDKLHTQFGVVGFNVGAPKTISLKHDWDVLTARPKGKVQDHYLSADIALHGITLDDKHRFVYGKGDDNKALLHLSQALCCSHKDKDDKYISFSYFMRGKIFHKYRDRAAEHAGNYRNFVLAYLDFCLAYYYRYTDFEKFPAFIDDYLPRGSRSSNRELVSPENLARILKLTNLNESFLLFIAADRGEIQTVKYLMKRLENLSLDTELVSKAAVDFDPRLAGGYTALSVAAEGGHLPLVRWLLEKGARWDSVNERGETVVTLARMKGRHEVALYIEHFARTRICAPKPDAEPAHESMPAAYQGPLSSSYGRGSTAGRGRGGVVASVPPLPSSRPYASGTPQPRRG